MCGKYTELIDSYKSVLESFVHAGVENSARVNIKWLKTDKITNDKSASKQFKDVDGILILPGFGSRGSEGKILSSKYARENNIPFLGYMFRDAMCNYRFCKACMWIERGKLY